MGTQGKEEVQLMKPCQMGLWQTPEPTWPGCVGDLGRGSWRHLGCSYTWFTLV